MIIEALERHRLEVAAGYEPGKLVALGVLKRYRRSSFAFRICLYRRDRHSEIAWVGCTDELEPTCGKKLSIQIVPKAVRAQRVPVVYLDEDRSPSSVTAKSIA